MSLKPDEFIRRLLLHVLPDGFHRIRHFGFFANGHRTERLALCRSLLTNQVEPTAHGREEPASPEPDDMPSNITPIFLPSRAPELNPVENIWQFMRGNWLSNLVFETYDDIIDAACDA